jgi:hypothetical protein
MERILVGRCRSGKIITSHTDLDGLDTLQEIFDAYAVLSFLAVREIRRSPKGDLVAHLAFEVFRLEERLDQSGKKKALFQEIGAQTAFDLRTHAMRLISPEFRA